jgi:hypothetical protein
VTSTLVSITGPEIPAEENIYMKSTDLGLWDVLNKDKISVCIQKGPSECQHWNNSFEKLKWSVKN